MPPPQTPYPQFHSWNPNDSMWWCQEVGPLAHEGGVLKNESSALIRRGSRACPDSAFCHGRKLWQVNSVQPTRRPSSDLSHAGTLISDLKPANEDRPTSDLSNALYDSRFYSWVLIFILNYINLRGKRPI